MALYAQQVQGGTGIEAPVGQVDYSGASRLGGFLGGLFGQSPAQQQANAQEQASQQSGALNAWLLEEGTRARAMLDQGDPALARMNFNRSMASFAAAGGNLDSDLRDQLSSVTGTEFGTNFLQSPTENMQSEFFRGEVGQQHLISAQLELSRTGEPFTEDDVQALALTNYATLQSDLQLLERAKAGGPAEWERGGRAAFEDSILGSFERGTLGSLYEMQQRGIAPTDDEVIAARQEFEMLVSQSIPQNLNDTQRGELDLKLGSIRTVLDEMESNPDRDWVMGVILAAQDLTGSATYDQETLQKLGSVLGIDYSIAIRSESPIDLNNLLKESAIRYVEAQTALAQSFKNEMTISAVIGTAAEQGVQPGDQILTPEQMGAYPSDMSVDEATAAAQNISTALQNNGMNLDNPRAKASFTEHVAGLGSFLYNTTDEIDSGTYEILFGEVSAIATHLEEWRSDGASSTLAANAALRTGIQVHQRKVAAELEARHEYNRSLVTPERLEELGAVYDETTGSFRLRDGGPIVRPDGQVSSLSVPDEDIEPLVESLNILDAAFNRFGIIDPEEAAEVGAQAVGVVTSRAPGEGEITPSSIGQQFVIPEEVSNDTGFINAVNAAASRVGFSPDDLLRVIQFETAGSWDPAVKSPNSTATGLIQFLESTANGLGTSTAALSSMSREEQMAYVERYLEPFAGRLNNVGDLYMAVHWPAGVGKDDNYVMYRQGSAEYDANSGLDKNGDGTVTRGETLARLMEATGGGTRSMTNAGRPLTEASTPAQAIAPRPDAPSVPSSAPSQPTAPATEEATAVSASRSTGENQLTDRTKSPMQNAVGQTEIPVSRDIDEALRQLSKPDRHGDIPMKVVSMPITSKVSEISGGTPAMVQRAIDRFNEDVDDIFDNPSYAGVDKREATADNIHIAGDTQGVHEGILSGDYKVGDFVLTYHDGRYSVRVLRPVDVEWHLANPDYVDANQLPKR